MKTLNIGLLLDSVISDKYVEELALWAKSQPDIELSHLIVDSGPVPRPGAPAARAILRLIVSVERLLLSRSAPHQDHHAVRDLTAIS